MKGDVGLFNFSAEHCELIDPVSSFLIVAFQRGNESELGIVKRSFYKQHRSACFTTQTPDTFFHPVIFIHTKGLALS